ncbi:transketolase family protein, partial [Leptospira interrogans serovar Pomona]|nr:transketolase family protein [Leptospira interrogans serovar Pomona]
KVGMKDQFGKSGTWKELLDYFGLRSKTIIETAKKAIVLKK